MPGDREGLEDIACEDYAVIRDAFERLLEQGIDSVSLNPDAVVDTWLALAANAGAMGKYLLSELRRLAGDHAKVGEIRGKGLMLIVAP